MTTPDRIRLKCCSVPYRKGFIEVTPNVHEDAVNIETWEIDASVDLVDVAWVDDSTISDASVVNNCELELAKHEAIELANAILSIVQPDQ